MGEVTAHTQVKSQNFVAGLKYGQANRRIGLCATMGLHIGIVTIKYFFQPVDCQLFSLVHDLATAIVAAAGITFSVFIGHHVAHGLHDLQGGKIFGGNQFNTMPLAFKFFFNEVEYELVSFHGAKIGQQ